MRALNVNGTESLLQILHQPLLNLVDLEPARPGSALIGNLAVDADDVQPIGPGAIVRVDLVVFAIEQRRHRHLQRLDALLGDLGSLVNSLRLRNLDQFLLVALQREENRIGMRFPDVDKEELRPVLVGLIDLFEVARLATERWSGVTAEDQDDRLLVLKDGQLHVVFLLHLGEREIGGGVAWT